jgi:hypothetical protein
MLYIYSAAIISLFEMAQRALADAGLIPLKSEAGKLFLRGNSSLGLQRSYVFNNLFIFELFARHSLVSLGRKD